MNDKASSKRHYEQDGQQSRVVKRKISWQILSCLNNILSRTVRVVYALYTCNEIYELILEEANGEMIFKCGHNRTLGFLPRMFGTRARNSSLPDDAGIQRAGWSLPHVVLSSRGGEAHILLIVALGRFQFGVGSLY
jgi:hypothetical protein